MVRVTVELVSAIDASRSRVLGVAEISLIAVAPGGARGTYDVWLSKGGRQRNATWKTGRVDDFPRKRFGGWDLLYLALRNILAARHARPSADLGISNPDTGPIAGRDDDVIWIIKPGPEPAESAPAPDQNSGTAKSAEPVLGDRS